MQAEFELRCPISADLGFIRDLIRMYGHHSGLRDPRLDNLVLAVNEAVTNVLDHAGKGGLIIARTTSEAVTVDVLDTAGRLTDDHLTAARTLDQTATHGYGLWVIQHLCDAVHLEQTGLGSRLSLQMRLRPALRGRLGTPFRIAALLSHL
jgi:anti-sigma regulatory factor (Ser/Thr protein kinase)